MSNALSPHETHISTPATGPASSYLSDTSLMAKLSQAWNSFCPSVTLGEAYTGFPEAINSTAATWGMSDESYILSRSNDEPTQYHDLGYNLRPTDPGVERMLEDFEKSEIEDWRFHMAQFHDVRESQWRDLYDEVDIYEVGFSNGTITALTMEEFQERLLDETLLDDLERYEEEEKEFWMMRGVAQMYGMWDEEYWQTRWPGPQPESTYRLGRQEIGVSSPLQEERRRDIKKPVEEDRVIKRQIHEVLWWEKICKCGGHGVPSVVSWWELPGRPNQCTEPRKLTHEMSPGMFKATEYPGPNGDSLASLGSECGQNSVYHELPEEDPDWVKLDKEHIALPLPPSPIIETYFTEIPKIPEPESEQDEAWTLIVPQNLGITPRGEISRKGGGPRRKRDKVANSNWSSLV